MLWARLGLALASSAAQLPAPARAHAEYLVTYGCTHVDKLEVPVSIMGAPSVAAPQSLASQFFVVRVEDAAHLGADGFGSGTQPVVDGSSYVAGETLHVTFLGGAGGELLNPVLAEVTVAEFKQLPDQIHRCLLGDRDHDDVFGATTGSPGRLSDASEDVLVTILEHRGILSSGGGVCGHG